MGEYVGRFGETSFSIDVRKLCICFRSFLGNTTDSFESRSLAPYTDETNVHYYRLKKDYEFTVGKAEPWFGQPG